MTPTLIEWIGYCASAIVAISMFLTSIVRLRWVNLVGAALFAFYGMMIDSWPVALLNAVIVCTDVYYLLRIYTHVDAFEMLEVQQSNPYILRFLAYYKNDIEHHNPGFALQPSSDIYTYMVLRNMVMVGVFIAHPVDKHSIEVLLDYVTPDYRDFKNGRFVYMWVANKYKQLGYTHIVATSPNPYHTQYLRNMGFEVLPSGQLSVEMTTLI